MGSPEDGSGTIYSYLLLFNNTAVGYGEGEETLPKLTPSSERTTP